MGPFTLRASFFGLGAFRAAFPRFRHSLTTLSCEKDTPRLVRATRLEESRMKIMPRLLAKERAGLAAPEFGVLTVRGEELGVSAVFDDLAVF